METKKLLERLEVDKKNETESRKVIAVEETEALKQ